MKFQLLSFENYNMLNAVLNCILLFMNTFVILPELGNFLIIYNSVA